MKDLLGNDLQIGDIVICTDSGYERLQIRVIKKFTAKGCRVAKASEMDHPYPGKLKFSHQVVKV